MYAKFDSSKIMSRLLISSVLLLIVASPAVTFAQDANSINALRQIGKTFSQIAEKTSPAVVWITAERLVSRQQPSMRQSPFGDPFEDDDILEFFFGPRHRRQQAPQRKQRQTAQGSGFIVSSEGYILTNNHVIAKAEKITVTLADKREFKAEIIGTDPDSEVAVIKIEGDNFTSLELADSDVIEVGEWVLAIGNPFGLSHTVTAGIISAKGRNIGLTTYEDYIQTDAAINPGNSGGPLINLDGKVIGINTAIYTRSGGNMGIGLAIPINTAKSVYKDIIETGSVSRGFLGIGYRAVDAELAEALELEDAKGVVITEIIEDSAAEKVGLKRYDVITKFAGQPIADEYDFRKRVALLKPGTEVEIIFIRNGKEKTIRVELGERPGKKVAAEEPKALQDLGLSVHSLTDELIQRYGYQDLSGVIVTSVEPDSPAAKVGIKPGLLIMEVNRKPVENIKQFNKAIKKAAKKNIVLLAITDGRRSFFAPLRFPEK
ncbi:Do family serine endopeptidase [Planctomycetota bacterium]